MSDCIEREAVKRLFLRNKSWVNFTDQERIEILKLLNSLPAADVRPVVRGKWISADDGKTIVRMKCGEPQDSCKCSVCGEWLVASDEYDVKGNFCPNCGALMEES